MTEIISFANAMCAHEQGKTVQFEYHESWQEFRKDISFTMSRLIESRWRIKPEPIKYSVDVWLEKTPAIAAKAQTLGQYLVGENNYWELKAGHNYKHYKITVEAME